MKPARAASPAPARAPIAHTTFRGERLSLIQTAPPPNQRYLVRIDDAHRRVRHRKTLLDRDTVDPGSRDWIEDRDAELGVLVECLESKNTQRIDEDGRLVMKLVSVTHLRQARRG